MEADRPPQLDLPERRQTTRKPLPFGSPIRTVQEVEAPHRSFSWETDGGDQRNEEGRDQAGLRDHQVPQVFTEASVPQGSIQTPSQTAPPLSTETQIPPGSTVPSSETVPPGLTERSSETVPITRFVPSTPQHITNPSFDAQPQTGIFSSSPPPSQHHSSSRNSRNSSINSLPRDQSSGNFYPQLQYHHDAVSQPGHRTREERGSRGTLGSSTSDSPDAGLHTGEHGVTPSRFLSPLGGTGSGSGGLQPHARPSSSHSNLSLPDPLGGRDTSPQNSLRLLSDRSSRSGRSPDSRPVSYVDLLNAPYPQPAPGAANFNNTHLRTAVGTNASLLSNRQTLEMYRANAKKTNEPSVQYEFALFMISAANEAAEEQTENSNVTPAQSAEMIKEARQILQRLSDRSYPFAQYYLADGYASGLFSKGKEDYDRGFPLFVSAGKHGHAEAGYRAALCYEFGWGCRRDFPKAVQFYRQSSSKNHPGAMTRLGKACLVGDLGLGNRYREGIKWLKRASEAADKQYNRAPYELGCLYEVGYGEDVFKDESYAAQLFTQAADLGHAEASFRLGDAYEHGKLTCPRDPALSVHFYNTAAQSGHAGGMLALCAWYIVGAEPVLGKDENEAYAWARKAGECGLAKAEYAVGYFTESGIGCRRDPLEANVWYVRAADHGDERAKQRLAAIRAAASGDTPGVQREKAEKECVVM